jgi:RNA polymerase sigma-70 factor (ECF subfamily)
VLQPGSDEELVRRCRAGDTSAFGDLVERHQSRVYHLCLRIVGDPDEARDAAQDALIAGWRKLDQFRGDSAFTTWLHRVTVNACYDQLRKRRRQPMLHLAADDERDHEPGPPLPDHADAVATSAEVSAALQRVPEEFRAALVLADVEDLPYDEIATILGVAVGTVKSRVHRGRVALARAMGLDREPGRLSRPSEEKA